MKFWFMRKSPKATYDGQAPYDATVEQVLRVAREMSTEPSDPEHGTFDFAEAFQANAPQTDPSRREPEMEDTPIAIAPPKVSNAAREEIKRRVENYREFQIKLNEEREARIRRTMEDVRDKLNRPAIQKPPPFH